MATPTRYNTDYLSNSRFFFEWEIESQDPVTNTTIIRWRACLNTGPRNGYYDYWFNNAIKLYYVDVDGVRKVENKLYSNKGKGTTGRDFYLAPEAYIDTTPESSKWRRATIQHKADGTGSFNVKLQGWLYETGDSSVINKTPTLPSIARYFTSCSASAPSVKMHTASIKWTTAENCDLMTGTLTNNATGTSSSIAEWTNADGATSHTFDLSNLDANTSYTIDLTLRRKDSKLTSPVQVKFTTMDGVTITNIADHPLLCEPGGPEVGDAAVGALAFKWGPVTNERTITLTLTKSGITYGTETWSSKDLVEGQIAELPLSISTFYEHHQDVTASYNNNPDLRELAGFTLTVQTNADSTGKPAIVKTYTDIAFVISKQYCGANNLSFSGFQIKDTDAFISTLTGTKNKVYTAPEAYQPNSGWAVMPVVLNYSDLQLTFPTDCSSTLRFPNNTYGALSSALFNGVTHSPPDGRSQTITNISRDSFPIVFTDKRNFSMTSSITVAPIPYVAPQITSVSVVRLNGIDTKASLTLTGSYWNGSFSANYVNQPKLIKYRKKPKNSTAWGEYTNLAIGMFTFSNGTVSCTDKVMKNASGGDITDFELGVEYDIEIIMQDQMSYEGHGNGLTPIADLAARGMTNISSGKFLMSAKKDMGVCFGGLYDNTEKGAVQLKGMRMLGFYKEGTF